MEQERIKVIVFTLGSFTCCQTLVGKSGNVAETLQRISTIAQSNPISRSSLSISKFMKKIKKGKISQKNKVIKYSHPSIFFLRKGGA